jgi:hypothetical protein
MTARLKDQEQFADRDEAEAARLLRVLGPSTVDAAMESRVYARLTEQPVRTPHRRWVVAFVGLLLVSTTILAAALVHRWATRPHPSSKAVGATMLPASQGPGGSPEPADRIAAPSIAEPMEASPPAVGLPGAQAERARPAHTGTVKRRSVGNVAAKHDETTVPEVEARDTSSSEARMAAAPSEEAALVLAAMRALRRAHDPVKAGVLLEQYLSRFPGGVLVEEALALGMEAALDRADAATARRLAERYTQRYPAGRFGALARRATASKGP